MKKTLLALFIAALMHVHAQKIFVSEFHYDGPGPDAFEFVELTGLAGNDLSCYKLYYVNATTGPAIIYNTVHLKDSVFKAEKLGYGTIVINKGVPNQVQNGPNDGFLLFDSCLNKVVQFISYEGKITSLPPYSESSAVETGINESSSPDSTSLQLVGALSDLVWAQGKSSQNILNSNLTLVSSPLGSLAGNVFLKSKGCKDYEGPSASVTLFGGGKDGKPGTTDDDFISVPTTVAGRFLFSNIPSGIYALKVNPPMGYSVLDENPSKIIVGATENNYFSFCMEQITTGQQEDADVFDLNVEQSSATISVVTSEPLVQVTLRNVLGQKEVFTTGNFISSFKGPVDLQIITQRGLYRKRILLQ